MAIMSKGRVLATGGTGYIGSHAVVELIKAGYEVEIIDNLYNSKAAVLGKIAELTGVGPKFYNVDMCDKPALMEVFARGTYDAVIHFAGLKAVGESVEQPLRYYATNVGGTLNLLDCMRAYGVKKIVFSSSATVYGVQETPKCEETMSTGSGISNPYGKTKFVIEEILKDAATADPGMEVSILRYFNPIGAHPSGLLGEDPNDRPNNLMPIVMKVATGEIDKLTVYGNDYPTPDGTCIRDYIHVVDLVKGHLAALEKMRPGAQIYNLGTGQGSSVMEIINEFSRVGGIQLPYEIGARRAGDLASLYADPMLAERELGWKAELSVANAMRDTLTFLRKEGLKLRV